MATVNPLESGGVQKYALIYGHQASSIEQNTLTITEDGEVQACIEHAQAGALPRELGWFHLTLSHSDSDLSALGKIIEEKKLIKTESISRPLVDGKRYRSFDFKRNGQERSHSLFVEEPVPEQLAGVMAIIGRLFERLENAPLQTLAMSVALDPAEVKPGDDLRIGFEFRAAGKFPVEFRNPAYASPSGAVSLRMNVWKCIKGANGEFTYDYTTTLDLGKKEFLLSERKAVPSDKPLLRLEPGHCLKMSTRIRFPKLDPGPYRAEAVYSAGPEPEGQEVNDNLVAGTFHADPSEIMVRKK